MNNETCGNCAFSEKIFGLSQGGQYDARIYCLCSHSDTIVKKSESCGTGWREKTSKYLMSKYSNKMMKKTIK